MEMPKTHAEEYADVAALGYQLFRNQMLKLGDDSELGKISQPILDQKPLDDTIWPDDAD